MILHLYRIYEKIDLIFIDIDFNVFINLNIKIIIVFYVNDVFIINSSRSEIQRIKNVFNVKFKMSDFDFYNYYLKIIIIRDRVNQIL